ncbi:MAG: beta-propeller fold lactonase family protein [Thermodesulfobacteriota bacterium]|jgi:6-phosphogluconolactonase
MKALTTTLVLLLQVLLVALISLPASAKTFVYVSCAEDGEIAMLEMNLENGDLKLIGKAKAGKIVMPMAVSPDRRFLYASIRSVPYSVASYSIDSNKGELTHLSTVPLPDNMAYISTDKTGRFLFSASYAGHKISVNPIGGKGLVQTDPTQVLITGRNAHCILSDPSNRFVYVPNLGSDQVMQLIFDEKTGILTPNKPGAVYTKVGAGPRHLDFFPNNRFVYVVNELNGMVNGYAVDIQTGLLTEIQSISAVPRDVNLPPGRPAPALGGPQPTPNVETEEIWAADIHITPDGRFLYASERTTSTLAAFAVDSTNGKLTYINNYATEKQPRGFNIDPRGNFVIAAGQKTDHCSVHRINRTTGELQRLNRYLLGKDPNWVEIVNFP